MENTQKHRSMWNIQACGICEKNNRGKITWFSPAGTRIHGECFKKIKELEPLLLARIEALNLSDLEAKESHMTATESIWKTCQPLTIKEYENKHGQNSLKHLFETCKIN